MEYTRESDNHNDNNDHSSETSVIAEILTSTLMTRSENSERR